MFVTFHFDLPSHSSFSYNCCRLSTGLLSTLFTVDLQHTIMNQHGCEARVADTRGYKIAILASHPRCKTRESPFPRLSSLTCIDLLVIASLAICITFLSVIAKLCHEVTKIKILTCLRGLGK